LRHAGSHVGWAKRSVPTDLAQNRVGSTHPFKYRLFYGYPSRRVVGYDNERGKGDHRHLEGREEPYMFSTVETLVADFLSDVRYARGES